MAVRSPVSRRLGFLVAAAGVPSVVATLSVEQVILDHVAHVTGAQWQLERCTLLRTIKHRKKRLLEYEIRYREGDSPEAHTLIAIGKLYGSDRGGRAHAVMGQLWNAGFRPPSPASVPMPLGYDPVAGLLLQSKAPGKDAASALYEDAETATRAGQPSGAWLARLHAEPLPPFPLPSPGYAPDIARFAAALAEQFPDRREQLEALTRSLHDGLNEVEAAAPVFAHGDFHPKNIFIDGAAATVIDFDTACVRDRGTDLGYFAAQSLIMARFRRREWAPAVPLIRGLVAGYQDAVGGVPWRPLAVHVARTFLQSLHYELCTLGNGRTDILAMWLECCERWLDAGQESDVENLLRSR